MTYADALERYMLELINEERTSRGLHELQLETNLNTSAEAHTLWMLETNIFSHTGINGTSSNDRIVDAGFDYTGNRGTSENIAIQTSRGAEGFIDDVRDLHTSLMNSPGHRANILSAERDYIGIGIEIGTFNYNGGAPRHSVAVTQNFGRTQGTVDLDDLNDGQTVVIAPPVLPVVTITPPALPPVLTPAPTEGVERQGDAANDNLIGTAGADTLIGGSGFDTLTGGDGNDLFIGGDRDALSNAAGGDTFLGGNGRDAVSYEGSFGSLRIDLQYSQVNTFAGAGDTYNSIEDVIGSQGADNIRGNEADNDIAGGRNVDYLFGRRGDDSLEGGVGDDVLFGGIGADVLSGGANRDRAQYSESLEGVRLDLASSERNTGEAAGDTYNSIEDLAGSRFNDTISGDSADNRLFGREANDDLEGRAGDDYLNGGGGQDTLDGGAGNDALRGGASRDTFVFNAGADVIEDWALDQINLDRDLWGGGNLSASDILDRYGNVVNGDTVFDFGSGNTLTVQGQTDMASLETFIFDF